MASSAYQLELKQRIIKTTDGPAKYAFCVGYLKAALQDLIGAAKGECGEIPIEAAENALRLVEEILCERSAIPESHPKSSPQTVSD